jgi:two-component system sensor kinase FixL
MAPSAQRRKIWIHAELADVPLVHADRVHVEQILLNLLLNSMDALDDSAKREIVVRTSSRGEGLVEVAVSDSGHGIAAEMLERIFEEFYTTKQHGMGLGLAVARSLTEAQGSSIVAAQNPGGGATVRFTIRTAPFVYYGTKESGVHS